MGLPVSVQTITLGVSAELLEPVAEEFRLGAEAGLPVEQVEHAGVPMKGNWKRGLSNIVDK